MKISISSLSEGVHRFHFSAEPADVGLGDDFRNQISIDVNLDKTGREVLLRAELAAVGHFSCDRCIDPFDREIVASYRVVYLYDERERARFPDDEIQLISLGASFVDITDDVRQFLMLAIPLKLLCSDACKGLCPRCGTNWNHNSCTHMSAMVIPVSES